jgi:hypothetical protein
MIRSIINIQNIRKDIFKMSDYCREKVLRYPVSQDKYEIEELYSELFQYSSSPHFQPAPTEADFIDYVLKSDYGVDCGEWGKTRALTENEQNKAGQLDHRA